MVRQRHQTLDPSAWLLGFGWNQNIWSEEEGRGQFPTKTHLDQVCPTRPVALTRVDGHALWCNNAALRLAGITAQTADPPGT